jgi:hypothetical protein
VQTFYQFLFRNSPLAILFSSAILFPSKASQIKKPKAPKPQAKSPKQKVPKQKVPFRNFPLAILL